MSWGKSGTMSTSLSEMEDEDEPEDEVEDESYSSEALFGAAETSKIASSVVFVGVSNFVSSVGMLST